MYDEIDKHCRECICPSCDLFQTDECLEGADSCEMCNNTYHVGSCRGTRTKDRKPKMDYKELIKYLRTTAACGDYCYNCQRCMDAATAIETLLAEREAAIEDLRGLGCDLCKHQSGECYEKPCCDCIETGSQSDHWEWRGPQKG